MAFHLPQALPFPPFETYLRNKNPPVWVDIFCIYVFRADLLYYIAASYPTFSFLLLRRLLLDPWCFMGVHFTFLNIATIVIGMYVSMNSGKVNI